jgi:hypothetical protein
LKRIGSPEALAVLQEAAAGGARGVRNAVKKYVPSVSREVS